MAQPIQLHASNQPTSDIELVTPAMAKEWLGANVHNRNMRGQVVTGYARDMAAGRWEMTGDPIQFCEDGTLLDGQHRLKAVIVSDTPTHFFVVKGLKKRAQDAIDTGVKRTTADALALDGTKKAISVAATASMIITDIGRSDRKVSTGEIKTFLEKEPFLLDICASIVPPLRIKDVTTVVQTYTYWRLSKISEEHTNHFFSAWSTLSGLPQTSPILALHRRMSNVVRAGGATRGRWYRQEAVACVFYTWNAWCKQEPRSIIKLAYEAGGKLSIPDPVSPRWGMPAIDLSDGGE